MGLGFLVLTLKETCKSNNKQFPFEEKSVKQKKLLKNKHKEEETNKTSVRKKTYIRSGIDR